jgi:choice-of-anchor A domain-containing protein
MKLLRTAACLAGLLAVTLPASAAFDLGNARNYNAYTFGGFEGYHGDTQGRLAVGGNLRIQNYGIVETYNHPIEDLSDSKLGLSLVVGGNATMTDSRVYYGSTLVNGTARIANADLSGNLTINGDAHLKNGSVDNLLTVGGYRDIDSFGNNKIQTATVASPVDFGADQTYLTSYSQTLSQSASTGTVTRGDSDNSRYMLTLTGDGSSDTQVFNLTASDLANAYDISLIGIGDASSVLINVNGVNVSMRNMGGGNPDNPNSLLNSTTLFQNMANLDVLFNFHNAESIDLYNIGIYGTLLATSADVTANEGRLTGHMIADTYYSDRNFQFNVNNIAPAPEPSEYLMMIVGLALVGFCARKRIK